VPWQQLDTPVAAELATPATRDRVATARSLQQARPAAPNARLRDADLDAAADPTPEASRLLGRAFDRLGLSARAARRALRVARTIADLAGEARVEAPAMAEALSFRSDPSLDP